MVHPLMRIFERWERFDGQMRLKICNYALNTLQHLCVISRYTNCKIDPKKFSVQKSLKG